VDGRHRVDHRLAGGAPTGQVEHGLGGGSIAQHVPVDEAHHVERRVVDRLVVAEAQRRCHGHGGLLQAADDAVLATHVVRAGQDVAERWPTHHERGAVRRR
jgi:hypothetical protein